jgi:MoaA/NifB/PqqE/SkfB family radical SAM enzyme
MNKNSGFIETYDSYLARLYPNSEQFEKNLFNITFQVTDACNLKCSYCY